MDLATAQSYLNTWIAAHVGLARNASYSLAFPSGETRTLTRTDGEEVRRQITYWHRVVTAFSADAAGSSRPGVNTPRWT